MKKVLSVILIATMLLCCMGVFASADTTPVADDGSDYLLALWDFENEENPYLDVVSGALIWARDGVNNAHNPDCMEVKDGVAKITAESIMLYLQYSQRVKTKYSGHENKTIFIKFYLDGTAVNSDASLIWHRNNDFKVSVKVGSTNEKYAFVCNFFGTEFDIPEANTPAKPADGWYYLALTMETYDAATKKIPVNIYLSADGTTYQKTTQEIEIADAVLDKMLHPDTAEGQGNTYSYFSFGKTNINYGNKVKFPATTGVTVFYDEIRFYDIALNADQMVFLKDKAEIKTEEETLPDVVTRTPRTSSETPTTEAPAATDAPKTTTAEADPSTTAPATTETAAPKDGCKSLLSSGALVTVLALAGTVAVCRKKHDN